MTDNLPPGWCVARLQSLVGTDGLMTDGDWVESKDQDPNGEVRLIQLADVGDGAFLNKSRRFLTRAKAEELNCTLLKERDVLIARLGEPLGKTCLFPKLDQPCVTVVDVHVVRPPEVISREWLVHLINSAPVRRAIESQSSGTTRKRVAGQKLKDLTVRVPPAGEQRRIASKIDELFSRIDEGERALERVQTLVERYRQSILKAAVTGELTREWREKNKDKLESGEALLARILKARREAWENTELGKMKAKGIEPTNDKWRQRYQEPSPPDATSLPELPRGWSWASADQLCREFGNGLSGKPSNQPPGEPILRISAVRPLSVDAADVRYYTPGPGESIEACRVAQGDLLFTRYNGSRELVGVSGVMKSAAGVLHPDKLIRARIVDPDLILPDYFAVAMNSGQSWGHITACVKTSAGQHGIAGSDIKRAPVPLPPIMEQERIVEVFLVADAKCAELRAACVSELRRSHASRQAVLKTAFSGQLVTQDPSGEPADVMLERTACERTGLEGSVKQNANRKSVA